MRVVIAVDERPSAALLARIPEIVKVGGAEVIIVHVLNQVAVEEFEQSAGHHLLRPHPPKHAREQMRAVDRTEGEQIVRRAAEAARSWGAARVETRLLEGSPKHEVVDLVNTVDADLLVVGLHGHEVGPKSIRKEARFMIDHAPCPVLIVRA